MGRQKKIFISGKVSNLIFYEFKGKECVRTMPEKVRQTKATKASALQFGKAVQISRALREGLMPEFPEAKDRNFMHRFNNAILQALPTGNAAKSKQLPAPGNLMGFDFFKDAQFSSRWKIPLSIDWKKGVGATVTIPPFVPKNNISAPAYTKFVRLHLLVTACDPKHYVNTGNKVVSINIPYNSTEVPGQAIDLPFNIKTGNFTIVAAVLVNGLKKETDLHTTAGKEWNPACIVEAFV